MKTFAINSENEITAFASEADASTAADAETFGSEKALAKLAAAWPNNRLVEIWNGLTGVKPVKKFTNRAIGAKRIWDAIQPLAEGLPITRAEGQLLDHFSDVFGNSAEEAAAKPDTAPKARKGAKGKAKATKKPTAGNSAPKGAKEPSAGREPSKTAQVVALLQRKEGATLAEIMEKMGWQKHTVRGFMAGAMKKAGYAVESFKPDGGERTYRISA